MFDKIKKDHVFLSIIAALVVDRVCMAYEITKLKTESSNTIEVKDDVIKSQYGQIMYLCHLCQENEIKIDEFDKIALNNPITPEEQ